MQSRAQMDDALASGLKEVIHHLEPSAPLEVFEIEGGRMLRYVRSSKEYRARDMRVGTRFRDFTVGAFAHADMSPAYTLTYTNGSSVSLVHFFSSLLPLTEHIIKFLEVAPDAAYK